VPTCDGRTDIRTDGRPVSITCFSIADARKNWQKSIWMADARSLQSIELKKITEKFTKPLSSPESVKAVLGEVGVYLWWKGFEEKVSHSGKDL